MAHLRIQEGQYTQRIYGLVGGFIIRMLFAVGRSVIGASPTADKGAELWRGGADSELRAAEPPKSQPLEKLFSTRQN